MSDGANGARTWPAGRFYWAVLDASAIPGGGRPSREQLGFLLEPLVPQPLEELHAVYRPLGNRRFLACAVPREALHEVEGEALSLRPDSLPEFVSESIDPGEINLLCGPHTPAAIRRESRRGWRLVAAFALASTTLLGVGLERRARAAERAAAGLFAATDAAVARALGDLAAPEGLPATARLEAEWRTLSVTRGEGEVSRDERDAAVTLSRLLSLWPPGVAFEPESLHVNPDSIHLRGEASESQAVLDLQAALEKLEGWKVATPSLRRSGDVWAVALRIDRAAQEEGDR